MEIVFKFYTIYSCIVYIGMQDIVRSETTFVFHNSIFALTVLSVRN